MKQLLFSIVLACAGFSVTAQTHSVLSEGNWVKLSTEGTGFKHSTTPYCNKVFKLMRQ